MPLHSSLGNRVRLSQKNKNKPICPLTSSPMSDISVKTKMWNMFLNFSVEFNHIFWDMEIEVPQGSGEKKVKKISKPQEKNKYGVRPQGKTFSLYFDFKRTEIPKIWSLPSAFYTPLCPLKGWRWDPRFQSARPRLTSGGSLYILWKDEDGIPGSKVPGHGSHQVASFTAVYSPVSRELCGPIYTKRS